MRPVNVLFQGGNTMTDYQELFDRYKDKTVQLTTAQAEHTAAQTALFNAIRPPIQHDLDAILQKHDLRLAYFHLADAPSGKIAFFIDRIYTPSGGQIGSPGDAEKMQKLLGEDLAKVQEKYPFTHIRFPQHWFADYWDYSC